jgi:hypothetical protein
VVSVLVENGSIDFQGKDPGERFQFYFRQHWIRLLKPFLRMLAETLVIVVIGYFLVPGAEGPTRRFVVVMLSVFFLLSQFEFLIRFYRYFLTVIVITDRKIHRIKKTLLTTNDHQSIDISSIQDINKSQRGVVQNVLGFGTLVLEAQDTQLRLHFTPDISKRYHDLLKLRGVAMPA